MDKLRDLRAQVASTTTALLKEIEKDQESEATGVKDAEESAQTIKPEKKPGSNRGIETMFRTSYRVQMELTALADNKANMMISTNAIIISIIIAAVLPMLAANHLFFAPMSIVLVGALVSVTFAILAARPRLHSEYVDLSDLRHSEGNILFFGNFSKLGEKEFVEGMFDVMHDKTLVYQSMIRDLYALGLVLNRKFALLQVAYTTFMLALLLGVLSFVLVFITMTWFSSG